MRSTPLLAFALTAGTTLALHAQVAQNPTKVDEAPASAALSWPFKNPPGDLERMEVAKRELTLAQARGRAARFPMTPAATPNYFMYWGVPFTMQLDTSRIAVMLQDNVPDAQLRDMATAAAQERGVATVPAATTKDRRFVVLTLAVPLADAAAINDAINALTQSPAIAFAAPVFLSDTIAGGIAYPTPSVMARVNPRLENQHLSTLTRIAPYFTVEWSTLGSMPGAARLKSDSKNGFDVMAQANTLANSPNVKWAEPAFIGCARGSIIVPNDPGFDNSWQHINNGYDLSSDWAWTYYGFGNYPVRVLVMDSGIDTNHPDINQVAGRDFTGNLPGGYAGGGPDYECDNHGTAVAGMISLLENNFEGGIGVCPNCPSISGKVGYDSENPGPGESCDSSWSWAADSTIAAIAWGVNSAGCDVTNSSWEAWPHSPGCEDQFADTSVNHSVMHFAATGNGSSEGIAWPSSAPYVWAVGSIQSSGARASSSNWGAGIDFTAPGASVYSADRTGYDGYSSGDYTTVSGTSFASPAAAGVAAYLKSEYPFATRSQIYNMMAGGVSDAGSAGYDTVYGYGRLSLYGSASLNAPANDLCGSAQYILGAATFNQTASTTWATYFPNEPRANCEVGAAGESSSVFYRYQSLDTGFLDVNTIGSSYDTVLSVFTTCGTTDADGRFYTNPAPLACNDDISTSNQQSQINDLWLDDGQSVLIKVSKYGTSGGGGTIDFNLAFTPAPPVNDTCGSATEIPLSSAGTNYYPSSYSTERATRSTCEGSETCGTGGSNGHSVWYEFTPPVDGVVTIDTSSSNYNTVLHLYQQNGQFTCPTSIGGNCSALGPSLVACDDDSGTGSTAKLTNIGVSAGLLYKIKISGRGATAYGRMDMNFTYAPLTPPANDGCANATSLLTTLGTHTATDVITNRAGASVCDGVNACGDPAGDSNSIWFSITPPGDILFSATTSGSNYNTVLNVYRGSCPVVLGLPPFQTCGRMPTSIACSDNISVTDQDSAVYDVPMTAGTDYLIKIADRDPTDEGGNTHFVYTIELPPPPPVCDTIDFNGDGLFPDTQDITDFISVFSGAPCPTGTCADIDFNNDGLFPDTQDITDLVNVFGGGTCP